MISISNYIIEATKRNDRIHYAIAAKDKQVKEKQ